MQWDNPKPITLGQAMLAISVIALLLWVIAQTSNKHDNPDPAPTTSSLGRLSVQVEEPHYRLGSGVHLN